MSGSVTAKFLRLITACLLATFCCGVYAAIPNSDNPDAYTEKQYRQDLLAYNKRTMSEAYLQVGDRDPKWDDLMIEYLDAQAVVFTNRSAHKHDQVPQATSRERLLELTALARDLGCNDPLVNYVYLINSKDNDERYLNFARKVYQQLLDSGYPAPRKLAGAKRLIESLEKHGHREEANRIGEEWVELFCAAATAPGTSMEDQLQLYRGHIGQLKDDDWRGRWETVCRRLDVPNAPNPWLVGMVCGYYEIELAWDARGSGFAYTVTDEGWGLFDQHLRRARSHLVKAWELAPQFPDTATQMIAVSMGLNAGEERLWFERAVTAHFDFYSAYRAYAWSIRPRWHGSIQQVYDFGVECLETGRFDTRVPSFYYAALQNIAKDQGHYEFWNEPGIYEKMVAYLQQRRDAPGSNSSPQWWDSMLAALAWRVGRYEDAMDRIKLLGDDLDTEAFTRFDGSEDLAPSECYARASVPASVFDEARKLWADEKFRSAAAVFDDAIKGMPPDDPARAYLRYLSVWAHRLHDQVRGTWIDLLGQHDLSGWKVWQGEWSADEQGRLTGVSNKVGGLKLECRFDLGYRFEVEGTITFPDDPAPEMYNGGVLFALYHSGSTYYHRSVLLDPNTHEAESATHYQRVKRFPADVKQTSRYHIQVWDEYLRLVVNDQLIFEGERMRQDLPRRTYPMGIGGRFKAAGASVRFDELKARPLTRRPAWAVDRPEPVETDPMSADDKGQEE